MPSLSFGPRIVGGPFEIPVAELTIPVKRLDGFENHRCEVFDPENAPKLDRFPIVTKTHSKKYALLSPHEWLAKVLEKRPEVSHIDVHLLSPAVPRRDLEPIALWDRLMTYKRYARYGATSDNKPGSFKHDLKTTAFKRLFAKVAPGKELTPANLYYFFLEIDWPLAPSDKTCERMFHAEITAESEEISEAEPVQEKLA